VEHAHKTVGTVHKTVPGEICLTVTHGYIMKHCMCVSLFKENNGLTKILIWQRVCVLNTGRNSGITCKTTH